MFHFVLLHQVLTVFSPRIPGPGCEPATFVDKSERARLCVCESKMVARRTFWSV